MNPITAAKAETAIGAVMATAPLWLTVVEDMTKVGAMVTALTGAIIGVHGVIRLWRNGCVLRSRDADDR